MSVRLLSLVAAAAATLVAVAPAPEARAAAATNVPVMKSENSVVTQVRRRGGGHHFRHYRGGGPRFVHRGYRGPRYVHRGWVGPRYRHSRRWRGPGFAIYAGVPFVGSSYYYGNSCRWLKRRAINTGSRYWWRRYNACRYGW